MTTQDNIEKDERLEVYEIGFHIVPIVSVDALPAEVNAIRSLIESNGGAIISEGSPQSRGLAYDISRMRAGKREKFDNAFFGWVKFETSPEAIDAIKQGIEKNENILRHLIIKTVRENTMVQPKPQMRVVGATGTASNGGSLEVVAEAVESNEKGEKAPIDVKTAVGTAVVTEPKMSEAEIDKEIDDMVKE